MKKVIFISALAIAAAVSCTKSDIVDTKFNEQISFETYTGRDAMTKATPSGEDALPSAVGVYGFYTGTGTYTDGSSVANLWANLQVTVNTTTGAGTYDSEQTKYWTNATDKYSFIAYAPYAATDNGITANGALNETGATITYKHPTTTTNDVVSLGSGVDLLYANKVADNTGKNGHVNMVKPENKGSVNLQFKHALSRITVTAQKASTASEDFDFDVKEVYMAGAFNTVGTLNLATATPGATVDAADAGWSALTSKNVKFEFYNDHSDAKKEDNTFDKLTTKVNYGSDDYLMVIPTDFTTAGVKLFVTYTTIYAGQESGEMTKELTLNNNFKMGKAYSIDLSFSAEVDEITFSVSVDNWDAEQTIDGGNPEEWGQNNTTTPEEGGDETPVDPAE